MEIRFYPNQQTMQDRLDEAEDAGMWVVLDPDSGMALEKVGVKYK